MTIKDMQSHSLEIVAQYAEKNKADGQKQWDTSAYMAGFVGDVGELSALVMAKSNFRQIDNVDEKISHELADCLWSILVLADQLDVDLESAFKKTMAELKDRIK